MSTNAKEYARRRNFKMKARQSPLYLVEVFKDYLVYADSCLDKFPETERFGLYRVIRNMNYDLIRQHSIRRKRRTLQRIQKRVKLWMNGRITNEDILGSLGSAFGLCQDITSALFLNKILYRCLLHALRSHYNKSCHVRRLDENP